MSYHIIAASKFLYILLALIASVIFLALQYATTVIESLVP